MGVIFIENTHNLNVSTMDTYDFVVTGSTWTMHHLQRLIKQHNRGRNKQTKVRTKILKAYQGVDPNIYGLRQKHPPLELLFKKHFVVFSGGKLEYRKVRATESLARFCLLGSICNAGLHGTVYPHSHEMMLYQYYASCIALVTLIKQSKITSTSVTTLAHHRALGAATTLTVFVR